MGFITRDKQIHDLAKELANLTGESITGAVANALRERLDRVRTQR